MNAIFQFELRSSSKRWLTYLTSIILLFIGVFCGNQFNLTVGEGIYLNSPYTIGFMLGMLSLSIIFFAILYSNQLLFKEWDTKFDLVAFSLPLSKATYLNGKFWFLFLKTFLSFILLTIGFAIGQNLRIGSEIQQGINVWHYLYPLIIFGLLNSLFVCSFLFLISYATGRKLLVVIGGLLLYVLYMVLLVFSNSPFMSGSLPQSLETQQISALLDPFGLSAYFFEARSYSVQQKNEFVISTSGILLINRIVVFTTSVFFLWINYRLFSFSTKSKKRVIKVTESFTSNLPATIKKFSTSKPNFGTGMYFKSILSFAKIDLIYLFKSITIIAISILLMFYIGMEMYAQIEKGIRLPENYASSGLLASSISESFHLFGLLILVYFVNDLYWRSHSSNFNLIEKSTYFSKSKLKGHFLSVSILLFFLTGLLIAEGLVFQLSYSYFKINFHAYLGVVLFNTLPLILFSAFLLLINDNIENRFVGLGVSIASVFALASPISKKLISYPLLHIFSGYNGSYSDFNGYGIYTFTFSQRLLFGLSLIVLLWFVSEFVKTKLWKTKESIFVLILVIVGAISGISFMEGYSPQNEEELISKAVQYEKAYYNYDNLPQPVITEVSTEIHLYPSKNAYEIKGKYVLENKTDRPIDKVLVNFNSDLKIDSAFYISKNESFIIDKYVTEIKLKDSLQPNEKASLNFALSYKWLAVNGHQSFNAIIENGSFMRISRYFPTIGYQKGREVRDEEKRAEFQLRKASELKKLEDPEDVYKSDFIDLNMTLSTEIAQTAIGTGDLTNQWSTKDRNYFDYSAKNIPFRFAISSAEYQHKSVSHNGVDINIFYHKSHFENVDHLLKNAIITLDYCTENFGAYPFESINFAEISSFTKGFAATAYPSTIFMTEDMIFHANIQGDKKQDVINELAGHELSHIWWGNSLIDPDEREGASMLIETLAMYTEMMLYKKTYGKEKMMAQLKIHEQIYENQKGLNENQPLYKVTNGNTHIAYSKGAIVMVELSELIGESNINLALRNFLLNNQYPKKPTSLDLLNELYKVAPNKKLEIDELFKTI